MEKWRIGVAFFYHESHSFVKEKTTMEDFIREGFFAGQEILDVYTGTKTEVGGFIDELMGDERFIIIPLQCAAAIPSGVVAKETYQQLVSGLIKELRSAGKLDGLLLALHGAMVAEGVINAEMSLIEEIRREIGRSVPLATTLDMHANISPLMTDWSPYHFGFKTYPHIDMYEQGRRAASAIMLHLSEEVRYEAACIKLPMLLPSVNMRTQEGPMQRMMTIAEQYEKEADILSVSVFGGFPYGDVADAGASVLVVAKTLERAQTVAKSISDYYWEIRHEFLVELPSISEGIKIIAQLEEKKPVVLADIADNPLSCGSGDTTLLIEAFLKAGLKDVLIGPIADTEALEICRQAGPGARVQLALGGKTYPEFGEPIDMEAEVLAISDGIFYNSGPFNHGLRVDANGAAFIRSKDTDFLVIGRPLSANDPQLFRHIGIEPKAYRYLVLKAKNHFRAAFDPLISKVVYVDAPGVATNKISHLPFRNIPRGLWPISHLNRKEGDCMTFAHGEYYLEIPRQLTPKQQQMMIELEIDAFPGLGAVDEQTLVPIARYGKLIWYRKIGDERPVAVCECLRDFANPEKVYIFGYYVRSDQSGKGLGFSFLTEVLDELRKDGFKKVTLTVSESNLAAVKLYEKCGFNKVEYRQHEFGEGEHRLYMEKEL